MRARRLEEQDRAKNVRRLPRGVFCALRRPPVHGAVPSRDGGARRRCNGRFCAPPFPRQSSSCAFWLGARRGCPAGFGRAGEPGWLSVSGSPRGIRVCLARERLGGAAYSPPAAAAACLHAGTAGPPPVPLRRRAGLPTRRRGGTRGGGDGVGAKGAAVLAGGTGALELDQECPDQLLERMQAAWEVLGVPAALRQQVLRVPRSVSEWAKLVSLAERGAQRVEAARRARSARTGGQQEGRPEPGSRPVRGGRRPCWEGWYPTKHWWPGWWPV